MVDRAVGQLGFADGLIRGSSGTELDRIAAAVDWSALTAVVGSRSGKGPGAPSYPVLVLLRSLLLGIWYDLSDPALEQAIADRLSFRRFVGLSLQDEVPDHTTLWRFRGALAEDGLIDHVFAALNVQLEAKGLIVKRGTLIDASLISAAARPPRKAVGEKPARPSRDKDARWGRKGNKSVFGYKIHIGADQDHTIIRRILVTSAELTDTEPADAVICNDEKAVYGDQAYYTHARHARLVAAGIKDRLMRRPNKHHPELPKRQKARNRLISKVRAAVERPFAVFKEHYGLRRMRFFTLARNTAHVILACCAYNLRRAARLQATA